MANDNLKLFDDIEREYLGPAGESESHWRFLNRTARQGFPYIRELLQNWFDDYEASTDKRFRLWKEFHSLNDTEHLSAFFELYLFQLFKKQGFKVEVEPEWDHRRPDFLLTSSQGEKILLEATASYPERWFGSEEKLRHVIVDYLNEHLSCRDYFLHFEVTSSSTRTPAYKRLLRDTQKWINELDYDQVLQEMLEGEYVNFEKEPLFTWVSNGWEIKLTASPKKEEARNKEGVRPIGSQFLGASWVTIASNIKSRIDAKYAHYGELDIPYILAINIVDPYYSEDVLLDAILGQETIVVNRATGESIFTREANGAWVGSRGYQKTRMSSLCVFNQLYPVTMHAVSPLVWHHPAANIPVKPDLIYLTQKIPNMTKRAYEMREGKHPFELLDIDETKWPKYSEPPKEID